MKNFVKACIAMAAFAAIFVLPSVASAQTTLTAPTGTSPLGTVEEPNKPFYLIATNVAHKETVKTTIMKTPLGNVECETATVTGDLYRNTNGNVEGTITTAEFLGTPGKTPPHAEKEHCKGGFGGNITVTPNHTTNPCHTPTGGTEHCSLPWCIRADVEDLFTVRGGACNESARALTFTLHTTTVGTCSYQKPAALVGTYTTHPSDAIVTINGGANATFTKTTGSIFCPSHGELFMAFTLTTDPGGIEGEAVYIDK